MNIKTQIAIKCFKSKQILIMQVKTIQQIKPYKSGRIRFFQLFLVSFVMFGNQYAFNNPQALQESFQHQLHIGPAQFDFLYTIFALPNIFATFIIGFLIDKLGVRIGIVTLSSGVMIFQLMIAIGGYAKNYPTILVGRMFFGIASESLVTAQASMTSFWFKGRQLAFALGIAITFPQLGNALNSLVSPIIYEHTQNLGAPLMTSVGICALSTLCGIWAAYLDKTAQRYDIQNNLKNDLLSATEIAEQAQQIKCNDLKQLKGSFWLIVTLCMFAVAMYVPFMDNANMLFIARFGFSQTSAGQALMITYIVAALFSAPLGILIDRVGFKRYFIIVTMVILTVAQSIFLFYPQSTNDNVVQGAQAGLVLLGLGYCFYANCLIPSVPLVVKKRITGTAFGIMQMIQSIALAFFPMISGVLVQKGKTKQIGYRHSSLFFVCMGLLGLLTSMGLLFVSDKVKKKLDAKSKPDKPDKLTEEANAASSEQISESISESDGNHQIREQFIPDATKDKYALEL